jgi:HSP20 family protein
MTMMRFNPNSPLTDLFDDLFGKERREKLEHSSYECRPATNILETKEGFELQMAVPGISKKDIKIDLEKNILNITSEKSTDKTTKENKDDVVKFTRREFSYGTFSRSFTLPDTINVDKIGAEVKDGILTVTLPKMEEVKVSKKISIS